MRLKIKKSSIIEILGILLYKLLLDTIYVLFIQNNVNYWGLDLDINQIKLIESYLMILIMYFMLPKKENKISTYIMQFQYLTIYIPLICLYALENNHRLYAYLITTIFLIMFTFLRRDIYFNIKPIKISKKYLNLILYIIIITTIIGLLKSGLIPSIKAFNFENVYTMRKTIKLDSLTAYLIGITTRVISPFLICVNYQNKNYKNIVILVILQLIIYSMNPLKSILFSIILVIGMVIILKRKNLFIKFIYTLVIICIIGALIKVYNGNDMIISLFIRRALFVPANIQFDYYDFFSNNQYLYMSNNTIGNIINIEYPYSLPIVNLISFVYYGQLNMAANTCYLAESYAQLGYLGTLIYCSIFIFINRILDWMSVKVDKMIIIPTLIFSLYALNDASLFTTMLTHGLVPGIVIIYMYMGTKDLN